MNDTEQKICRKLPNVLVDVNLVAEIPSWIERYYRNDPEEKADALKRWVSEFHEFIRDHRSQDAVNLSVERVTKDLCSFCQREWEVGDFDDGKPHCEHCGALVEEIAAGKEVV